MHTPTAPNRMTVKLRTLRRCAQLAALVGTLLLIVSAAQAQTLKADYQFQNTRASFTGNPPALADLVAAGNNANNFTTDTVDGVPRTVLNFATNNGLSLSPTTGVIPNTSATIVLLFKFATVTSPRRVLDLHNGASDFGAYITDGVLENCTLTCTLIPPNTYVQVVYTRDGATKALKSYVNGILQDDDVDSFDIFAIDANNVLRFFQDDNVVPGEASAGAVARIRLYDAPLTPAQVAALDRLPAALPPLATIRGRVTDASGNPLSFNPSNPRNQTVFLSGTATATSLLDANGIYTFNVPVGGDYTVTLSNPYIVFTPATRSFTNLISNQLNADFAGVPGAVPQPSPPLSEDFAGTQRDPTKFNLGTLSQPLGANDRQVSVAQASGRLVIAPRAGVTGLHYNGYTAVRDFDFNNAVASVEVPQVAAGGAESIFSLGTDGDNYFRFIAGMSNSPSIAVFARKALAEFGILDVTPVLVFQVKVSGLLTQQVVPYDPVQHRFWRFRHDAPMNAILFETSRDNAAYTERFRLALQKSVSSLGVELNAGTATPTTSPGATQFDNLSLVTSNVQFSAASFTVGEGDGRATLTVSRSGNVNSVPATLTYATVDNPAEVRCDDTTTKPGVAFARCDYATSVDIVSFAAGETTKSFTVPIIDDVHVEGNETFQVVLRDAMGGSLGAPGLISVTIMDNDGPRQANPIFTTPFFVRQQYLDFLAREPEQGEPWSRVLNNCADVNTGPDVPSGCDRIVVSGAFFGSPEFKDKGLYVIIFYRVAFNRLPAYLDFAPDLRSVTGATPDESFAKRAAFARGFTQRAEFTSAYNGMTDAAYVTTLLNKYQLSAITAPDPQNPDGVLNPDGTRTIQKVTLTQTELVSRLATGALTRAQVLRAIVQSDQISASAEATNAFVAAQYYGYLRRTPDTGGFNGWVNYLATHPGDFRTMVNGFVNSIEYRLRFGAGQ